MVCLVTFMICLSVIYININKEYILTIISYNHVQVQQITSNQSIPLSRLRPIKAWVQLYVCIMRTQKYTEKIYRDVTNGNQSATFRNELLQLRKCSQQTIRPSVSKSLSLVDSSDVEFVGYHRAIIVSPRGSCTQHSIRVQDWFSLQSRQQLINS